ncbi:MAG: tRNA (guanosine(37)-N1)-methyltransferase TrmD [Desulfatibacillaceae bacterium]|nr:tRNA (guanosine(37)-N1)-methyltransferase TrmD [Desulfatibacillaceae bacterium]
MDFIVLTLFPGMFSGFFSYGVLGRALESGLVRCSLTDIRQFAKGRHLVTDDRPFGGGTGMVFKPEPLTAAIRHARELLPEATVCLLGPQGRVFNQKTAGQMAAKKAIILVCGRYEGIDERVLQQAVDIEISVGDFVLSGGEPAAMVILDAVARLVPGVLGNDQSAAMDSFENGLLEHPHYTRPRVFEGEDTPEVLLSGHHKAVEQWRQETGLLQTLVRRPDLLERISLSPEQAVMLGQWSRRIERILGPGAQRAFPGPDAPSGDK